MLSILKNFNLVHFYNGLSFRTRRMTLGIGAMAAGRFFTVLSMMALTALTSRQLTKTEFGLWSILVGLSALFATFDLGVGNSLRNKLVQLTDDVDHSRKVFFGAFNFMLMVTLVLSAGIFFLINNPKSITLPLASFTTLPSDWITMCSLTTITLLISLPFSFGLIGFLAYQEAYLMALFEALRAMVILILVIFAFLVGGRFVSAIIAYNLGYGLLSVIGFFYFLFRRRWLFEFFDILSSWKTIKSLMLSAGYFWIHQISMAVILLADGLILSLWVDLGQTGDYLVVQRLFSFVTAAQALFLIPMWSAYSDAHHKKDTVWLKRNLARSLILTIVFVCGSLIVLIPFGEVLVRLWTGKEVLDRFFYISMGFWVVSYAIATCYSVFLNGLAILKVQAIMSLLGALIKIPLSFLFVEKMGPIGVCWAGTVLMVAIACSNVYQTFRYFRITRKRQISLETTDLL